LVGLVEKLLGGGQSFMEDALDEGFIIGATVEIFYHRRLCDVGDVISIDWNRFR